MAFRTNKTPVLQEKSASGSVASFNTALAMPLKSCIVDFEDGTGIDSLDFSATGKNLFDKDAVTLGKWVTNNNTILDTPKGAYSSYIPIITNIPYYFSHIPGIGAFYSIAVYNEDKIFIETVSIQGGEDSSGTITFIQGSYIRVNVYRTYLDIVQVELGDTATTYEPFGDTKTFSFGKTIQNGLLNVLTGELTNNDTTPPEVINLGGMNIETLQGVNNNIWADTGDIDLTYKDLDIAKRGNFREVFKLPS